MPESQGIPSLGNTFQWMKKATRLDRTYESVNEAINVIHFFFFPPFSYIDTPGPVVLEKSRLGHLK